jgi:hypothetical protein
MTWVYKNTFTVAAVVGVLAWVMFTGNIIYQTYRTYNIIPVPIKIEVLTPIVKQGGQLTYQTTYTKTLPVIPIITRELVGENAGRFALDPTWRGDSRTGTITNIRTILLPILVTPQRYYLSMTWTYEPNPNHEPVSYRAESGWFTVVP